MKKSQRRVSILMTVILLCSTLFAFTGCSGSKKAEEKILDPANPVNIVIWHYYNGIQQNTFNELVDQFNSSVGAEKGIIVEAHSYGSVEELSTSLNDSVNGKIGSAQCPDIFSAYKDTAYSFDQAGKMVDLSEYFSSEELNLYVDDYLESSRISDDTIKLLPVVKSTELLFLNNTDWTKFSSETGASESSLSTWEGIAKTAEQYYNWSGGKAFFGRDAMANYIYVGCAQLGKELYSVDSQGNVSYAIDKATIKKLWDNFYVPYVKGYYTASGKFRSDDAKTGKLIACIASSSSANYFPKEVTMEDGSNYPIDVKVLKTPGFSGGKSYAIQQGAGMGVMKSDKQHEYAACEFLKWFTASEQNCSFASSSGYLPVEKNSDISKYTNTGDTQTVAQNALSTGVEMLDTYSYYEAPVFDQADTLRNTIASLMTTQCSTDRELVIEKMSAGASLDEAITEFTSDAYFDQWYDTFSQTVTAIK